MNNSLELSQNEDINLRLRTLNLIRWIAVLGQFSAVVIAFFYFQIVFNIYICILLILLSVTLNIVVSVLYPLTKILNYNETFFYLVFDLIQLVSLLYLTGGLTNPFCVLILAPLVIAATYLDFRRTVLITVVAIISLNFLAYYYFPLESITLGIGKDDFSGFEIFLIWSALVITSIFITAYCFRVADDSRKTRQALRQSQLSLSNEEQVSALMSLTAAAVHELGTPLSTISIINKELVNNNKDGVLGEDLLVIQSQLERCKEILERLRSNNLSDKSNEFINQLNFIRLINEIVSPYDENKIKFHISFDDYSPKIVSSEEIIDQLSQSTDTNNLSDYLSAMDETISQRN